MVTKTEMQKELQLVLFDCDGTLVDSAVFIQRCMEETFRSFDYSLPSFEATRAIIGLSLDKAIAVLLQKPVDKEVQAMVVCYKQTYHALRTRNEIKEKLYTGIQELIDILSVNDHILLGVVTGKSRRGVEVISKEHGLDCFVVVRTADDCPSKPHPAMVLECCIQTGIDPERTWVVGDSIYDMEMAKAAKAKPIGVMWGYHSADALRNAGALDVLERPMDLLQYLEQKNHA